ncbi:hypothetical protein JB92DRAFT_2840006 [Gautieria morchelliformis]|nr:hypothetical protein JB92DRAFT_2840006 [Gautieria morchelliformis]
MSQVDPSAEIQVLSDKYVLTTLTLALLIYDTLLTLPCKIKHIWCKTVKIGTILYLFARYLSVVLFLVTIYGNLSTSIEVYYHNALICNTLTDWNEYVV